MLERSETPGDFGQPEAHRVQLSRGILVLLPTLERLVGLAGQQLAASLVRSSRAQPCRAYCCVLSWHPMRTTVGHPLKVHGLSLHYIDPAQLSMHCRAPKRMQRTHSEAPDVLGRPEVDRVRFWRRTLVLLPELDRLVGLAGQQRMPVWSRAAVHNHAVLQQYALVHTAVPAFHAQTSWPPQCMVSVCAILILPSCQHTSWHLTQAHGATNTLRSA